MKDKDRDLARSIVDWFFAHDCTTGEALKAVIKILKEANHDKR